MAAAVSGRGRRPRRRRGRRSTGPPAPAGRRPGARRPSGRRGPAGADVAQDALPALGDGPLGRHRQAQPFGVTDPCGRHRHLRLHDVAQRRTSRCSVALPAVRTAMLPTSSMRLVERRHVAHARRRARRPRRPTAPCPRPPRSRASRSTASATMRSRAVQTSSTGTSPIWRWTPMPLAACEMVGWHTRAPPPTPRRTSTRPSVSRMRSASRTTGFEQPELAGQLALDRQRVPGRPARRWRCGHRSSAAMAIDAFIERSIRTGLATRREKR